MSTASPLHSENVRPIRIDIPQRRLVQLVDRVRATSWPSEPAGSDPWSLGADVATLKRLAERWANGYDWRLHEEALNRLPQFQVAVGEQQIYCINVRTGGVPLLLTHGFPASFHSFLDVIDPLSNPEEKDGDGAPAFDVVIPSLPGYPFSPCDRIYSLTEIADLLHGLMLELGYERYMVAGGGWGDQFGSLMALRYPEHVIAIHLQHHEMRHAGALFGSGEVGADDASPAELDFVAREAELWDRHGAYALVQGTRPQSLAFAMQDSPIGALAWLIEKWYAWAEVDPDTFLEIFPPDRLLTEALVYILSDSVATSTWLYAGAGLAAGPGENLVTDLEPGQRIEVPVGVAGFPSTPFPLPPREFIERSHNVVRYTLMPAGGHFACVERAGDFVDELRAFARQINIKEVTRS